MMKKYSLYNNNASWDLTQSRISNIIEQSKYSNNYEDELSNSSYNSQILDMIRSIVDELYQINNEENLSRNEPKEKRVRFTLKHKTDKTESIISNKFESTETSIKNNFEKDKSSIKSQPLLSDSTTVICCLIKGRSKVDCSVSTNDLPSLQCECATQTMNMTVFPECKHSLISLLTVNDDQASIDLHRSRSHITLSTTSISSKLTTNHHSSSFSTTNHTTCVNSSLYSCENNNIVSSLSTAHQLIIPTQAKHYDICQEQILDNYNTLINSNINIFNSSSKLKDRIKLDNYDILSKSNRKFSNENITETNIKLCTCSKRKLSDIHISMLKFALSNQDKLLKELHLSKRSLQSMYNDGLYYVHDLVLVFIRNISQFYQILLKHYYLSKKQANLFVKIMNKWWKKHQTKFIDINEKSLKSNIIK
ncbi:unnamed protein product [Rotaria sordida]|uniref:Uncharacterized protein n=1 Tax=Rotaria sordida TaxID=392033 RepID=A0A818PR88_9BILA|nr:unnamed protein product [Rotaria sordida]